MMNKNRKNLYDHINSKMDDITDKILKGKSTELDMLKFENLSDYRKNLTEHQKKSNKKKNWDSK